MNGQWYNTTIGCIAQKFLSIKMVQRNWFTLVIVHRCLVRSSVEFLFRRIAQPFWNRMSLLCQEYMNLKEMGKATLNVKMTSKTK